MLEYEDYWRNNIYEMGEHLENLTLCSNAALSGLGFELRTAVMQPTDSVY